MKRIRWQGLAVILLVVSSSHATTWWVQDCNKTKGRDGSESRPFCTIKAGVEIAEAGDTVLVLPGIYTECVDASAKPITLVARDFLRRKRTNTTVVDGTGVCDGIASPAPCVRLGDGSTLQGFTLRDCGFSGVRALGGVTITNNVINGNRADFGGGIYVKASETVGATTGPVVKDNDVRRNSALGTSTRAGRGGGIYVEVPGGPAPGQAAVIEGNTVRSNRSFGVGGGIAVRTLTPQGRSAEVVITKNTLEANVVNASSSLAYGYGGGLWAATYGEGDETILVEDNTLKSNTALSDGGGASVLLQGTADGSHRIELAGNAFSSNRALGEGGGLDVFARANGIPSGPERAVLVRENEFVSNTAEKGNGGGLLSTLAMIAAPGDALQIDVRDNLFETNRAGASGGGGSLVVDVRSGENGEASAGRIAFRGNALLRNESVQTAPARGGGGLDVRLTAVGRAEARADLEFLTVDSNRSASGAGGVEWSTETGFDDAGRFDGLTGVSLLNSIVTRNDGYGVGGPGAAGTGRWERDIRFVDVFGNAAGGFDPAIGGDPGPGQGILEVDPLLGAGGVPGICSPTIDAADPQADVGEEPEPNGGTANLGHTGRRSTAQRTLADVNGDRRVDGMDALRVARALGSEEGDARYVAAADLDADGDVDGDDLSYVVAAFGDTCP